MYPALTKQLVDDRIRELRRAARPLRLAPRRRRTTRRAR
jgi:hypothetical protein